jgi:hypothetical protein
MVGSNPVRDMDVLSLCFCVVLSCVGRGLCDGLITRPKESYRVSYKFAEPPALGGQGPCKECRATDVDDDDDC